MKTRIKQQWIAAIGLLLMTSIQGCVVLYKVQLGDMDRVKGKSHPISVKVSETTVNFREAADIAKGIGDAAGSTAAKGAGEAAELYTLFFQFGPRTGTPVYNELYAREVPERLFSKCKNGYLTDIISVRESKDYPVIKGEIIRIDAICVQP